LPYQIFLQGERVLYVVRHQLDCVRPANHAPKNPAAFETYFAPNVRMQNGRLVLNGIPEVEEHYRKIWSLMQEEVNVDNFSFDGKTLAVQLHTHFTVLKDADNSPFGKVKGEHFDYYGVVAETSSIPKWSLF
jgi:hypothetical protein